jgi:GDPmannose 4,6-dehydratase
MQQDLFLGNLSSRRDWGHAKDYIRAMYLILQQDKPDDYVIATGITTTIRDFVLMAFNEVGVSIEFRGSGLDEKGYLESIDRAKFEEHVGTDYYKVFAARLGDVLVGVNKAYFRPTEVELLIGDATKARTRLNWEPKYDLKAICNDMMLSDIKLMKKETYLKEGGYRIMNYFE